MFIKSYLCFLTVLVNMLSTVNSKERGSNDSSNTAYQQHRMLLCAR